MVGAVDEVVVAAAAVVAAVTPVDGAIEPGSYALPGDGVVLLAAVGTYIPSCMG
jgi:hypothetical protein